MSSSQSLISFIKKQLAGRQLVVALQKQPYMHIKTPKGIVARKGAGGVHILLDGVLKKVGGLMVATSTGDADHEVVDRKNRVKVPPGAEKYTLKRIFLTEKENEGFYYGFANQTLWPLCHAVFVRPIFNSDWWDQYVKVNRKFADSIVEEIGDKKALIWINDYHLALLPTLLRKKSKNLKIGAFWHIPWPTYEILRICPWRREIMAGLLGSDFIGFHRGYHVENFIASARRELGVIFDSEPLTITYKGHTTKIMNLPAGIDYHEVHEKLDKNKKPRPNLIKRDFGFDYKYLALGVDRVDYTKGLVVRLQAIDKLLEKHPRLRGKFVYLSLGAPSRTSIPTYKDYIRRVKDMVRQVNLKYAKGNWKPIYFINKVVPREKIFAYYQLADVCLVTALDDGMNLVAKEFIICNNPEKGMLILSIFAGAAKDLTSAILINPYDTESVANAIYESFHISAEEKKKRNLQMKEVVRENNIYKWAIEFIKNTLH